MPAFYTHYVFGRIGYKNMKEGALKKMVRRHKKVYALGLLGPDIFFYFAPDQLMVHPTPGTRLHEERCGAFLRAMMRQMLALSGKKQDIAAAYLAGFIGHYALDTSCHPHVYAYIEEEAKILAGGGRGRVAGGVSARVHEVSGHEKTGIHFRYECAIDYYCLQHYAALGTEKLRQGKMVKLTKEEKDVIAKLVAAAYNETYDKPNLSRASMRAVLFFVKVVQRLIRDPRGRKERVLCPLEKFIYKHPYLAGLFVNNNCYGVGKEEWEKMHALFQNGLKEHGDILEALGNVLETEEEENRKKAVQKFYRRLGNKSYHTGMTVD